METPVVIQEMSDKFEFPQILSGYDTTPLNDYDELSLSQ